MIEEQQIPNWEQKLGHSPACVLACVEAKPKLWSEDHQEEALPKEINFVVDAAVLLWTCLLCGQV